MNLLCTCFLIILNIFMPVICWGPLAKSAQDPTTIPDYIAAKILDHNVNPSAHGLDGYSVYNHRISHILDHPDYSIISDKITAEQIIAKDFRTDKDVGVGVDGIKFDKNAIEAWESGDKNVYIPKSGSPLFKGKLKVQEIAYLKTYARMAFDSVDMWVLNAGSWTAMFKPAIGRARLSTDVAWYGKANAMSENSWITASKNPFFEMCLRNVSSPNDVFYFGLGECDSFVEGIDFLGFQHDQDITRALMVRNTNPYWYQIHGVDNSKRAIWRAELDKSNSKIHFLIDNKIYHEAVDPGLSEFSDYLFQLYLMTTNQYRKSVDCHFLAIGEDL